MKTVKIFLASSEELREERIAFGDFINGLRRAFKPQGIDLELVKWEDLDSAFNGRSKEDEYIEELKKCQLFVALFHTRAGMYTQLELDAARRSIAKYNVPAIFIFMKDLKEGETQTQELEALKERILKEWRHFNDSYNHIDTLKLRFLQQLIIKLNDPTLRMEVENSVVRFNRTAVANLDNVPFAANNDRYREIKTGIADANKKIEAYEQVLAMGDNPVIEGLMDDEKRRRADLLEELAQYENDLLATAQRIAALKTEAMNERLRKAVELFESGDNKGADALLDMKDIDDDIRWIMDDMEKATANAKSIISQLTFKAQNLLTLYDNPDRIDQADEAYTKALEVARKACIDGRDIVDLLEKYHRFLMDYAIYEKVDEIGEECLRTSRYVYGEDHPSTVCAYNNIGLVYDCFEEFEKALEYFEKALNISEKIFGKEHPKTATLYNNIGTVYDSLRKYEYALEYLDKALLISKKTLGTDHPETATSYNNIGAVYNDFGDYEMALEYFVKGLAISEKTLGTDHPETAISYNNVGSVFEKLGDVATALAYQQKALEIQERMRGKGHPETYATCKAIGEMYHRLNMDHKTSEYFERALSGVAEDYGSEHPATANAYYDMGREYIDFADYDKALECYCKATTIWEKILKEDDPNLAIVYNNLGLAYDRTEAYDKALEYFFKVLEIQEKALGEEHPESIATIWNIAMIYEKSGEMEKAYEYMLLASGRGDENAREWIESYKNGELLTRR